MKDKQVSEYDLYIDELNKSIEIIKQEYEKCPNRVNRKMQIVAKEIKADNINSRLSLIDALEKFMLKLKISDVIFYTLIVFICLLAPISEEGLPGYLFGIIFLLAGLFIGLYLKGFGLIFLFSHGATGLGIMIGTLLTTIPESGTILLSNSETSKIIIGAIVILILITIISTVIHNLSDDIRKIKYFKIIPVATITLIILICKYVIPVTMFLNNILRLG